MGVRGKVCSLWITWSWNDLEGLRRLTSCVMAEHTQVDGDFVPANAVTTRRVHVSAGATDWELLVDGTRFFDTQSRHGGGGAVDLVMYLWRVPFKRAVKMLREAGV